MRPKHVLLRHMQSYSTVTLLFHSKVNVQGKKYVQLVYCMFRGEWTVLVWF